MRRYRRYPSFAIIALASLVGSPAWSQEEFTGPQLAACAIDIPVHCGSAAPGGGRIVKCLQAKRAEITTECRDAVTPTDFTDGSAGLKVEVTIDQLASRQGTLIVMLNADAAAFPKGAKRTVMMPLSETDAVTSFRHLRPGTYAISALHDLNDNGAFDKGEGFATSNSVASPPSFAASAMKIDKDTSVTLSMRYP